MPSELLEALLGPGAIADLRRSREAVLAATRPTEMVVPDASGQPVALTARQRAFHLDADPLPGASWPRQRRTGWERED